MPTLLVHGWWNIAGAKMSKSLGNVVDPDEGINNFKPSLRAALEKINTERVKKKEEPLPAEVTDEIIERCASEAVRYYLMSDIATGKDADFSEERLIQRYNTDLANSVGNLLNRSLNMAAKYRAGLLKCRDAGTQTVKGVPDFAVAGAVYEAQFDGVEADPRLDPAEIPPGALAPTYAVHLALDVPIGCATLCNQLIETRAPWKLAKDEKNGDQMATEQLDAVLYTLAESLRIIAILISPVLPKAAHGIFDQLNWKLDEAGKDSRFRLADAVWGELGKETGKHQLGKPVPLFPRIETAPAA
jgi:methionyl-tRNA synthetase